MEILKIILNIIIEFISNLEPVEIIVTGILSIMISSFVVGFLNGELTQWTLKCYGFFKENTIFILIFMILIYINGTAI